MNKNRNFFSSFKNAASGLLNAFLEEANIRFHFMIANLIIIFAYFYGLNKTEWAILFLMIIIVLFAELINTSLENAVDTATKEYSETAKSAKDIAAGSVFLSAVGSLVVGVCLFGNGEKIASTLTYIFTSPKILIPCLMVGISDILLLVFAKKRK